MTTKKQPVHVRLTIRDVETENEVFFSNEDESVDAIEITPGSGEFFPKIDTLLPSMKVGERKSIILDKKDAFGDQLEEAIKKIPLETLPEKLHEPGTHVVTQLESGQEIQGTVILIKDQHAIIDFNHPLAGKTIQIDFVIVANK